MSPIWSWALTLIGITGWWLVGNNRREGFVVGIAVQFLWVAYAITSRHWGLLASAFLYGSVAARNWSRWGRER